MEAVVMPKLGLTMTEGTVATWLKQPGDVVEAGEAIAEIETDKITYTLEAPVDGRLVRIDLAAGESAPVSQPIAWIGQPDESPPSAAAATVAPSAEGITAAEAVQAESGAGQSAGGPLATPFAKKTARENNVALSEVTGSGPNGRIQAADVEEFLKRLNPGTKATPAAAALAEEAGLDVSTVPSAGERVRRADVQRALEPRRHPEGRLIPHSAMRASIANRMSESWGTIPHVTVHRTSPVDGLMALHRRAKETAQASVSLTAVLACLVSRTLLKYPALNAHYESAGCLVFDDVDLGVAVSVPGGLVVPVIRDANRKCIPELAEEIRGLSERARSGGLELKDLEGGTFTISNLGMYDVDGFTPIIVPPQVGILGVGRTTGAASESVESGAAQQNMTVSLSFDHRAVDGAYAAQFLSALARSLADPLQVLL
ncbi:MAG: 2-oxo acid dehydrogenase subunit E2 [Alicyclobacillus sp.]|nr:2-oxo acid dehydrogenase subunit E2 [Alicyclobacillus sp.]